MQHSDDEFDRHLQEWLEPDQPTVDRVTASAFDMARQPAPAAAPPLLVAIGVAALIVGGFVAGRAPVIRTVARFTPGPVAARTSAPDRTSAAAVASEEAVSGVSDGSVMVIQLPDGSAWAGNVNAARTAVKAPAGTGRVVLEGGAQ